MVPKPSQAIYSHRSERDEESASKCCQTNYSHPCKLSGSILLSVLCLAAILAQTARAQIYREWRDTTLPEMRSPHRIGFPGQPVFPIGLFVYDYDNNEPLNQIIPYLTRTGIDHILFGVHKSYDTPRTQNNWTRYQRLLDTLAEYGKRLIPLVAYGGEGNQLSYIQEGESGREITFYPFDSSQMREMGVYENLFTSYQYDSTVFNPNYVIDSAQNWQLREVVYNPGSMTNQTVASGIAFDFKPGQTDRFDDGADPVNSSALFEQVEYASWNSVTGLWDGDHFHTHRSPHYVVITGHLFPGGGANFSDTLLRVNVWYDVDQGKTYRDSAGNVQTAATNLHLLYKSIGVTKWDLYPIDLVTPSWNEYRDVIARVSFQREGMGGPTDTGVSAHRFDLEVQYLGGEKLALRSVAVRDSITNLLLDDAPAGVLYRAKIAQEVDDLVHNSNTHTLFPAIYTLNIADEPFYTQFAGFRRIKQLIQEHVVYPGNDSLSSLNGAAIPFLQWLGDADWLVSGNYLGNHFYDNGGIFDLNTDTDYQDVPSVKQHNGGKWHIPELFDFDSLDSPLYRATLPERIEQMELLWNHARMGAAVPGQTDLPSGPRDLWRVRGLYESAVRSRDIGRPFLNYIGQTSWVSISFQNGAYDTNCDHRFEPSALRAIIRLGLAYGAKGLTFYKMLTLPWGEVETETADGRQPGHVLGTQEIALCGENISDTANNFIDWVIRDPSHSTVVDHNVINDTIGVLPGLYVGYKDNYRELAQSLEWVQRVGPVLQTLRWRDAYSLHFQSDLPSSTYDDAGIAHRVLPSSEIVTAVNTRHPITGKVDSSYATYVELGLFETKIDTTDGVRNRVKDTNYVMVVNRRIFDVGDYDSAEIGYSSSVKALLDTLTETRTIELTLNLRNPDVSGQYNRFLRVQEIAPDLAPLPLIGSRRPLDSILVISTDGSSKVRLTLGPGRAALLRLTYAQPDESISNGLLTRNNQRKLLYDAESRRYYATYHRYDSALSGEHVFFRRSIPVDTTGTIQWEPMEWPVSEYMDDGDFPRIFNSHPSITYRHLPSGDTRVSIVWTAHPYEIGHPVTEREVLIRDITYRTEAVGGDTIETMYAFPMRSVGFHYGQNAEEWGTPVISSCDFGDYVAWSDSTAGIILRARRLNTGLYPLSVWSGYDSVERNLFGVLTPPGQYPTMPPFGNRPRLDSTVGLAWQTSISWGFYTGIVYFRMQYIESGSGPSTIILPYAGDGSIFLSPNELQPEHHVHPSLDATQDALGRVQEGITWEYHYSVPIYKPGGTYAGTNYFTRFYFRPLGVDGAGNPIPIGNSIAYSDGSHYENDIGYGYPVISSQNQVMVPADSNATPLFSIVYEYSGTPGVEMSVLEAQYTASPVWNSIPPHMYAFGGRSPNGAASEGRQTTRYAALYQRANDSVLRTTREFFSKSKPTGYLAQGVDVGVLYDPDRGLHVSAELYDPWLSGVEESRGLKVEAQDDPESLSELLGGLRSESFAASDSVRIGTDVWCRLSWGGSPELSDERVDCYAELIDSATGGVVWLLDSFALTETVPSLYLQIDTTLDLLSGTYYLRLRVESASFPAMSLLSDSVHWSQSRLYGYVPNPAAKPIRRVEGETGNRLRISAQPNPIVKETEVRFSIPRRDYVMVTLYDALGRSVRPLVERELYEAGRYAVELEGGNLLPGTYLVELQTRAGRVVEKVLLVQ